MSKGVLAQPAADRLREHYGDIKSVDKKWFVIILCSVLGTLLIGLGIILLFGHNWEELSRPVRAVLSLLPLMVGQALAMWVVFKRPESQALKEGTATFLSLMVGASIALISQTYNIPGDTPTFILTDNRGDDNRGDGSLLSNLLYHINLHNLLFWNIWS